MVDNSSHTSGSNTYPERGAMINQTYLTQYCIIVINSAHISMTITKPFSAISMLIRIKQENKIERYFASDEKDKIRR